MQILNTCFIVLVDDVRMCFDIDGVPLRISVAGKSATWHRDVKYDKQPRLAETKSKAISSSNLTGL